MSDSFNVEYGRPTAHFDGLLVGLPPHCLQLGGNKGENRAGSVLAQLREEEVFSLNQGGRVFDLEKIQVYGISFTAFYVLSAIYL